MIQDSISRTKRSMIRSRFVAMITLDFFFLNSLPCLSIIDTKKLVSRQTKHVIRFNPLFVYTFSPHANVWCFRWLHLSPRLKVLKSIKRFRTLFGKSNIVTFCSCCSILFNTRAANSFWWCCHEYIGSCSFNN